MRAENRISRRCCRSVTEQRLADAQHNVRGLAIANRSKNAAIANAEGLTSLIG
jgi:hypothetical protein